jgi:hypothetical protein
MTDNKNKYVLAEIKRLEAELAEANRMYALAYDAELEYGKASSYGKNASMHYGNELCALWSMLHVLDGRRPDWKNSEGLIMPVSSAYRRMLEAGELEGKSRREIDRIAFAEGGDDDGSCSDVASVRG